MSKFQTYIDALLNEATIPSNGGEVKMPEADWKAHMTKIGAKVRENGINQDTGAMDHHIAKDKFGNRIGHYDTKKKTAYFEKRHGQGN